VLTAAHCIDPEFQNSVGLTPVVYCGSHASETNDPELIFNAVEGHVHSFWTGDTDDGYDVGLLKLNRESNASLPAIDSHSTPIGSGEVLTALGWGRTDSQQTADTLQMAENLHYVPPIRCEQELRDVYKNHMICAGLLNEDTCKGDSGGPLLISDKPDGNITAGIPQTDLIVGVTSFGSGTCDASVPGVYIRVGHMWQWIVNILDEQITARGEMAIPEERSPENSTAPVDSQIATSTTRAEASISSVDSDDVEAESSGSGNSTHLDWLLSIAATTSSEMETRARKTPE